MSLSTDRPTVTLTLAPTYDPLGGSLRPGDEVAFQLTSSPIDGVIQYSRSHHTAVWLTATDGSGRISTANWDQILVTVGGAA